MEKKIYQFPALVRKASACKNYVVKKSYGYFLGTGRGEFSISEEMYKAFIKESKVNKKFYVINKG